MRSQLPSPEQLNPSIEKTRSQLRVREKTSGSSSSKKRAKKSYPSVIRRSERIQNVVQPYQNRDIEPVVEEIAVSDSEKEDEPLAQGEKELDEPTSCEQNLHGKIDYVVKLLETQGRAIKNLLSESLSPTEVQTLMDENQQLTQKLETALCKVEAYEKGNQNFSEVLEKLKDVMLVSNLTKVTETAVNASSQAIREAMSSGMGRKAKTSAAKGKKRTKTK
ncbi:uncharacterized protein LOC111022677 isoform X6 [Momordica charantia]|uniref:Uncharacterized protein LOC111022677 isoform X6 n=1 Tax=Momordica charantia TaxID=3673 RepID=A0A6J1DQN9_MOMCH|nr:uncharacterized protein LOC111022677 isoform X6 [Momordica charantia]